MSTEKMQTKQNGLESLKEKVTKIEVICRKIAHLFLRIYSTSFFQRIPLLALPRLSLRIHNGDNADNY